MESSITSHDLDQPTTSNDYSQSNKDSIIYDENGDNEDLYTAATISMNGFSKKDTHKDSMSPVEWNGTETLDLNSINPNDNQERCKILIWPQPGHIMCPPMVMITQPSQPNTPMGETEFFGEEETSSGSPEETSEVESFSDESEDVYESDFEYSVSETVSFALPPVSSINGPSTTDLPFLEQNHEDLRGRVESFLAQPPPLPIFTCSVTYDGQLLNSQEHESWDSADEGDEEEDKSQVLSPTSSKLNGLSRKSSDEESNYNGQTVGATLTLVQKAALKEGEDSDTEEYYEDQEYSDETDIDESDEEFTDQSSSSFDSQSDEESFESEMESVSMSFESISGRSERSMEEISEMKTGMEETSKDEEIDLEKRLVTSIIIDLNEESEEAIVEEIPEESPINPLIQEFQEEKGETEVKMEPTYVNPLEEKIKESTTSRYFPEKNPPTDFARKAIIQPPKLEKVKIGDVIETKIAEPPKKPLSPKLERKVQEETPKFGSTLSKIITEGKLGDGGPKDKSGIRKSALNMSTDEAKRKEIETEEAAKKSARRYNLVGNLAEKFKEATQMPKQEITYRRSKALQSQNEERPRRKIAPIIQPVVNDDFDKQMEELREKMKAEKSAFQKEFSDLKKGMISKAEETKIREQEHNHKMILDQAAKLMGKADQEKRRQKDLRDAEIEKELSKSGVSLNRKDKEKKMKSIEENQESVKSEPRRTVRRIKQTNDTQLSGEAEEKPIKKTSTVSPADKLAKPILPKTTIEDSSPSFESGSLIDMLPSVNEDNLSILETAHDVATKKRSALEELRNRRSCGPSITPNARIPSAEGAAATRIRNSLANASNPQLVKSQEEDIKPTRAIDSTSPNKEIKKRRPLKKYGPRRKTEEIILPPKLSAKPKRRREYSRINRFIRKPNDIDMILGWEKEGNDFESFERLFSSSQNDKIKREPPSKRPRRHPPSKIWISQLTDIDKIYKTSELRDIIASAQG